MLRQVRTCPRAHGVSTPKVVVSPPIFTQADITTSDWDGPFRTTLATQCQDAELREIVHSLRPPVSNGRSTDLDWSDERRRLSMIHRRRYALDHLHGGRLVHRSKTGTQVVVPFGQRFELLGAYHRQPIGGHRGTEALHAALKEHYYWPSLYTDCHAFVHNCEV